MNKNKKEQEQYEKKVEKRQKLALALFGDSFIKSDKKEQLPNEDAPTTEDPLPDDNETTPQMIGKKRLYSLADFSEEFKDDPEYQEFLKLLGQSGTNQNN